MARKHETGMMKDLKELREQIRKNENLRFVYHVFTNHMLDLMVKTVPNSLNEFKLLVTARNKQKYAERFVGCIQNYIKTNNVDLMRSGVTFEQCRDANLEKSSYFAATDGKKSEKKRKSGTISNNKKKKKKKKKKAITTTNVSDGKNLNSYSYNR